MSIKHKFKTVFIVTVSGIVLSLSNPAIAMNDAMLDLLKIKNLFWQPMAKYTITLHYELALLRLVRSLYGAALQIPKLCWRRSPIGVSKKVYDARMGCSLLPFGTGMSAGFISYGIV